MDTIRRADQLANRLEAALIEEFGGQPSAEEYDAAVMGVAVLLGFVVAILARQSFKAELSDDRFEPVLTNLVDRVIDVHRKAVDEFKAIVAEDN